MLNTPLKSEDLPMAYKVGTTIVIDDTGYVPWARISGAPAAGLPAGEYTKTATEYQTT